MLKNKQQKNSKTYDKYIVLYIFKRVVIKGIFEILYICVKGNVTPKMFLKYVIYGQNGNPLKVK